MKRVSQRLLGLANRLLADGRGATAIEYAMIAGVICLGIVGWATLIGGSTNASFEALAQKGWGT